MNYLTRWFLVWALIAMPVAAFDFNNSTANYDFTQTVEIFIVDQKNSKFFAMRDPFEMTVTTAPSRFYVSVLGVIERGHRNADGVSLIEGTAAGYEYVLIFKSLNSSHVMFIGKNWVVDGNKKILLTAEEISAIYEVLLWRSGNDQKMNMSILELLFKEINEQQDASDVYPKLAPEDELKSIVESKKSIQERLPESHDDTKTLPYYNKALENQKFLAEHNAKKLAAQKLTAEQNQSTMKTENTAGNAAPTGSQKSASPAPVTTPKQETNTVVQEPVQRSNSVLLGACIAFGILFLFWVGFKRRMH